MSERAPATSPPAVDEPLSPETVDRLVTLLFERASEKLSPPRRLFAVLDGARSPRIHPMVLGSPRPFECLYRGELDPLLAEVAPYLVELEAESFWTRQLLTEGWGRSWGIFLEAAAPIATLQRHLRSFAKVKDESGRTLVFRYYDPRVLRVYLPTTNAAEARTLTGPIGRFLLESRDGQAVIAHERRGDAMEQLITPLAEPPSTPAA